MRPHRLTRRQAIVAGLASVAGVATGGVVASRGRWKELPPTYGHILRMADNLTYVAHHTLLPGQSLAREYTRADISTFPAVGTLDPGDPRRPRANAIYRALRESHFADWRLSIEGLVSKPTSFSLAELQRLPSRTQITRHMCEEGWSAIAEWTGVPLSRVLEEAGAMPAARFVTFYTHDDGIDSIDMMDALHPQTLLAYAMNGNDLPVRHGAPVRLRLETQLGYKSMKYIERIVVSDTFNDGGKKGNIQNGWSWYAGI